MRLSFWILLAALGWSEARDALSSRAAAAALERREAALARAHRGGRARPTTFGTATTAANTTTTVSENHHNASCRNCVQVSSSSDVGTSIEFDGSDGDLPAANWTWWYNPNTSGLGGLAPARDAAAMAAAQAKVQAESGGGTVWFKHVRKTGGSSLRRALCEAYQQSWHPSRRGAAFKRGLAGSEDASPAGPSPPAGRPSAEGSLAAAVVAKRASLVGGFTLRHQEHEAFPRICLAKAPVGSTVFVVVLRAPLPRVASLFRSQGPGVDRRHRGRLGSYRQGHGRLDATEDAVADAAVALEEEAAWHVWLDEGHRGLARGTPDAPGRYSRERE